jgi:hypothetical protein
METVIIVAIALWFYVFLKALWAFIWNIDGFRDCCLKRKRD